ncbi:hypothetical protein GCM10011414_12970 [Croceivirga lutea]|uniref:ATP-binding protein n=1 Tax=Croceivirga lutea TaxID=1775167 RepID=UPI0016396EA6|nr:ATP-binding protein [Croceivirga lutea]GGG44839.1 hypothetical protein GCM10011414_12970 [Croceivirga lutea]
MESRDLLAHLEKLEKGLEHFSFSELNGSEATNLKNSFLDFKNHLEAKMFGDVIVSSSSSSTAKSNKKSIDAYAKETSLIANVSHEIRTPLNGIVGFIDLLKDTQLDAIQEDLVSALSSTSNNLMVIINELLEFSKIAAGQERFEAIPFRLKNMVEEIKFLSETLIVDKAVTVHTLVDSKIPEILIGDPSKLSQVLLNLMGNAVKFVEKGNITLNIKFKHAKKGKVRLQFDVIDTGIGISEENIKRIFETYQQAEDTTAANYGGTGLGLSIVKQIIEKQGGLIKVASILGRGTTFTFELDFEHNDTISDAEVRNHFEPKTAVELSQKNILVIEDNLLNQKLFKQQLEINSCNVAVASNGVEGLKFLEENPVDLVLLDLRLPILNGFEIAEKIRSHKNTVIKNLPLLAVSADISVTDKEKCVNAGINDYLLKPYLINELKQKIVDLTTDNIPNTSNTKIIESQLVSGATVNILPLYKECLENADLLGEFLGIFEQNIIEFIGAIRVHTHEKNYKGIEFATHKIKSSLQLVHADGLFDLAVEMENLAKSKDKFETIKKVYHAFLDEYPQIQHQINTNLNLLKPPKSGK